MNRFLIVIVCFILGSSISSRAADSAIVWSVLTHDFNTVDFYPDDSQIITTSGNGVDGGGTVIYKISDGSRVDAISKFKYLTFWPDNTTMLGLEGGKIVRYNAGTFEKISTVDEPVHYEAYPSKNTICMDIKNNRIYNKTENGYKVYDLINNQVKERVVLDSLITEIDTLGVQTSKALNYMRVNSDGNIIFSIVYTYAKSTPKMKSWIITRCINPETKDTLWVKDTRKGDYWDASSISPDNKYFINGELGLKIYDANTGNEVQYLSCVPKDGGINNTVFSHDSKEIAFFQFTGQITLVDIASNKVIYPYKVPGKGIGFSHNGQYLAGGQMMLFLLNRNITSVEDPKKNAEIDFRIIEDKILIEPKIQILGALQVRITQTSGAEIFRQNYGIIPTNFQIPIGNLPIGSYLLQLQTLNQSYNYKFNILR